MAADLATSADTGLRVQACGDAHLSNFGGFSAPDRALLFDINDFDETSGGPFEWDVKRLAASFEIAARARAFSTKETRAVVARVTKSYREAMAQFAGMTNLTVWYTRLDVEKVFNEYRSKATPDEIKRFERNLAKAQAKDNMKAFEKLTEQVDGEYRIKSDPPVVVALRDLLSAKEVEEMQGWLEDRIRVYRRTLQPDRRRLLESYRLVDFGRKVVGVGSVGTRCWIALLLGRDSDDPLFLQVKEAEASVLEAHAGSERVRQPRPAGRGGPTAPAGGERHHARLAPHPGLDGVDARLLRATFWDRKLSVNVASCLTPAFLTGLRPVVRLDAGPGGCPLGDRDGGQLATSGSSDTFDLVRSSRFAAAYATGTTATSPSTVSAALARAQPSSFDRFNQRRRIYSSVL